MIAEQTLYFLNGHGSQVLDFTGDYTFFIDIPFYFNRVPPLSIPTTAISKQLVEVVIKLNPLANIINGVIPEAGVQAGIKNMSLDTEFVLSVTKNDFIYSRCLSNISSHRFNSHRFFSDQVKQRRHS